MEGLELARPRNVEVELPVRPSPMSITNVPLSVTVTVTVQPKGFWISAGVLAVFRLSDIRHAIQV